ncbi:MAG TPA: MMPL family transporter [Motilibacterales bacterium]|nr:MMPL family transporter [Motilibacterales bacterium]
MAPDQPPQSPMVDPEHHGGPLHDAHSRGGIRLRRWAVPALIVVFWLFVVGPLGSYAGQLSEVQENDAAGFLPASAESTQVRELSLAFSTSDTLPAIVVYEFGEPIDEAALGAVASDIQRLGTVPGVTQPVIGPVPSEDRLAVTVIANLEIQSDTEPGAEVEAIRALLEDSPARALGAEIYVTGPAGVLADFAEAFGEIDGILLLVALGVVLLILLIVYRSPVLPLIVLFTSLLALGAASFVIYQLAANDVITLSGQSQGILFILVIGATTDYSLLLVARFREELRRTEYQVDAMRATLRGTVEAILASGGTVILGVMTLVLSELNSNRGLGPVAAVGIAFAMLSALTFLPAVLVMLGRRAFWPVRPSLDLTHPESQVTGFWARVATTVDRKPRVVLLASSAVLLVLCAFVPTFKAEGVPQSDFFLVSVESTQGQDALARHFPAGSGSETLVIGPQELAEQMTAVVTANEGVASVVPLVDGPPGPDAQPLVVDGDVLLQATLVDQADSAAAEQTVVELRADLDAVSTEVLVGGTTAIQLDTKAAAQRDLRVIIPAVLLVTLIVLILLLRAIVAPLVLIGTVIVSFAATIGLAAIVFYQILDLPGADASVPLFAFVFLAALGVDYNIFLMTRAREETIKHGNRAGMLRALAVTGGVITSAGIVLAATFSALALLPLLFLFEIAFLVAAGVLIDTLIVRSLVVPSAVIVIGPRTWWPSKLARASHELDEEAALAVAMTGEEDDPHATP